MIGGWLHAASARFYDMHVGYPLKSSSEMFEDEAECPAKYGRKHGEMIFVGEYGATQG